MRLAAALPLALALLTAPYIAEAGSNKNRDESIYSDAWSSEYDHIFRKYSKRYFGPHFDWRWFKAQAVAESGLQPSAKSGVGARGVMQIMPATYAEIRQKNPYFDNIESPRWNIAAGIYYNHKLYKYWPEVSGNDRLYFTFGSYNAGLGSIVRAVNKSGRSKERAWNTVADFAPEETRNYVSRIKRLKKVD